MEQAGADKILSERTVDSDSLVSENIPIMEACACYVLSERTVASDSPASATTPIMVQACADNVPSERTVEYASQASERIPVMVQACAGNVLSERNVGYNRPVSRDIPRIEVDSSEINHDNYRFAYQLVEKVLLIRGELVSCIPHNLPEPSNYLFTEEHESFIENFLARDAAFLTRKIHLLANGIYNTRSYLNTRDQFVKEWGNSKNMPEKSFIAACATIAYLAAYFTRIDYNCGALDDIVVYIARWFGTIDRSFWRPH